MATQLYLLIGIFCSQAKNIHQILLHNSCIGEMFPAGLHPFLASVFDLLFLLEASYLILTDWNELDSLLTIQ